MTIVERLRRTASLGLVSGALMEDAANEIEAWRSCAKYDPQMEGPVFNGWDRSAMDRCRKQYIEKKT